MALNLYLAHIHCPNKWVLAGNRAAANVQKNSSIGKIRSTYSAANTKKWEYRQDKEYLFCRKHKKMGVSAG